MKYETVKMICELLSFVEVEFEKKLKVFFLFDELMLEIHVS